MDIVLISPRFEDADGVFRSSAVVRLLVFSFVNLFIFLIRIQISISRRFGSSSLFSNRNHSKSKLPFFQIETSVFLKEITVEMELI